MTDVTTPVAVDVGAVSPAPPASPPGHRRVVRPSTVSALVLLVLMAFSVCAHLGALGRDLPLPDADEDFFVRPAAAMAATGDLNPHWFGHPGSTVIYPVAALIHTWDAVLHDGPVLGSNPALERRLASNPRPFYLIARLWVIALSVASIPMVFGLGRRAFNRWVGLVAAVVWTVIPYAIHFGRIARTESAATLFGLVALYGCVRAWREPRLRWWVLAGLGVGLAVSSRYFMVTLVPCLVAATVVPLVRDRRRAFVAAGTTLGVAAAGFLLTTPFALLDLSTVRNDLGAEANLSHSVAGGLSPAGNLWWYVSEAIPDSLTWPLYVAALLGIVVIVATFRRRRAYQVMLVAFTGIFLVAISASQWHWQRWTVEILPLLVVFAAVAVHTAAEAIAARAPQTWPTKVVVTAVLALALAAVPLSDLSETNRYDAAASTARQAREWMQEHVASGTRVGLLPDTFNVPPRSIPPLGHGITSDDALDPTQPLADYRRAGVEYVAMPSGAAYTYMLSAARHPKQAAFFTDLTCKSRLVAQFPRSDSRFGLGISIYRLDRAPVRLLNVLCTQPAPRSS